MNSAWNDILEKVAKDLHSGKMKHGQVSPEMIRETAQEIFKGVTKGFDSTITTTPNIEQYTILQKMRENVFVFSGFKNYHELKEISLLLTDNDGKIRPFSEFLKDVKEIDETYTEHYLKSEYDHAVSSGTMMAKFEKFKAEADIFPMLRYRALHDGKTRPEHLALDKATYPIGHDFWKTYLPPNGWRCRCDVDQVEEQAIREPIEMPTLQPIFRSNVAIDGVVFPKNHPYFNSVKDKKTESYIKSATDNVMKSVDYDTLKTNSEFLKALKEVAEFKNDFPNLDNEELASIKMYTGNFYSILNNELRKNQATHYNKIFEATLNRALDKLPIEKNLSIYRGTSLGKEEINFYINAWKNKQPVTKLAFTSTTTNLDVALAFLEESNTVGNNEKVMFFIKDAKQAKNIQKIGIEEEEFLYKSKAKFDVIGYDYDKDLGHHHIILSENEK